MAHSFSCNNTPSTGSVAMYIFLTTLQAATWTRPKDSDGTTYSSSGAQLTSGSAGTNGLGNSNAWFVVRDPNSARSFCFQRGATNQQWRLKYSRGAGFTGGSPSATEVPSATDEVVIIGSGTDASPGFANWFQADGAYRFNCCATDSTLGYAFYFHTFNSGNVYSTQSGFMLDVMASGSFPSADTDPAVITYITSNASAFSGYGTQSLGYVNGADCPHGWLNNNGTLAWKAIPVLAYVDPWQTYYHFAVNDASPGAGINSFTGKDDSLPVGYSRLAISGVSGTPPYGFKGFGQLIKFGSKYRSNYDTISIASSTSRDYIYINATWLPWNGSIPVI